MSQVKQLGAELSSKLAEMEAVCKEHGYEVTPTLLLRHDNGPSFSMLLGNDDLNKVVLCIAELGNVGEVVEEETNFEVGDLIEAIPPYSLACGSGIYPRAVLVSIDPFMAVSEAGDMLWQATISPEKVKRIGKALPESLDIAMDRFKRHVSLADKS